MQLALNSMRKPLLGLREQWRCPCHFHVNILAAKVRIEAESKGEEIWMERHGCCHQAQAVRSRWLLAISGDEILSLQ